MKTANISKAFFALTGASILAMSLVSAAHADRKRAPIVFAEQGERTAPTQSQTLPSQPMTQVQAAPGRRVEFRYPDQPNTFYGAGGARTADSASNPIAFSSSEAALSAQSAQQYTAPKDPAITSGGFDARAAAASAVQRKASAPAKPIRIASLQTQQAAKTGAPLTLSRVSINRDAKITEERGLASVYTEGFNGQPTANGEIFDETAMTAAHPSLPLPSLVQVVNEQNNREIVVRVNDRGPFDGKRILELSPRAANVLGMKSGGSTKVSLRYLGPAPVQNTDSDYAVADVETESLPPVQVQEVVSYPAPQPRTADPVVSMTPPVQDMTGNVFIQAGSFADIANAQNLTAALGRGMPVKIEEARVNGGDYFRVMIGPFNTRSQAEIQQSQLESAGIVKGFITTR